MDTETTEKITYTPDNLPPVQPGTSGHLRPKTDTEGTTAACVSPIALDDLPYPKNWNKPLGATMVVPPGGWITSFGPADTYYNREFAETSSITGKILDPATDPRAAEIADYFDAKGLVVLIVEAVKNVGVEAIGIVASEAVGHDLLTTEGPETIGPEDIIVRSVRTGDVHRLTPAKRAQRYAENGRIFDGPVPPEYR